jgi:hypothetical protein
MTRSVFGSGGSVKLENADHYKLSGILGQFAVDNLSIIGTSSNGTALQGFWVPDNTNTSVEPDPIDASKGLNNYPNPFSTSTKLLYTLPSSSYVTLKIYDLMGNTIKVLYEGVQSQGLQQIMWDGTDKSNSDVTSGTYYCELTVKPAQMAGQPAFEPFSLRNVIVVAR